MGDDFSSLQDPFLEPMDPVAKARARFHPPIAPLLENLSLLTCEPYSIGKPKEVKVKALFPLIAHEHHLQPIVGGHRVACALRVGVLFSGGPAPGGHNVIAGLYDGLIQLHQDSRLIGFLQGFEGLVYDRWLPIEQKRLACYRNMGGFDLLGSGRMRLETLEQLAACRKQVVAHQLDGLVIIGGDDSNTNAAMLAQDFAEAGIPCSVIGVPKTIDNDLTGAGVELSFGHDTACRLYSELIAAIARDGLSSKKYYHFIRLMGRSASHITLECALQTHPTWSFIGEEIAKARLSFEELCENLAQLILRRASKGLCHGIILVPEGLIEFIPEFRGLFEKLDSLGDKPLSPSAIEGALKEHAKLFFQLPQAIQGQLLSKKDAHGNLKLSSIATEALLMERVQALLAQRGKKVEMISHYLGYEARAIMPTDFDASYTYSLGKMAALLAKVGANGFMAAIKNLHEPIARWQGLGVPLTHLMHLERRSGQERAVIAKNLVDLNAGAFQYFACHRHEWAECDRFRFAGPIQYFGPPQVRSLGPLAQRLMHGQSIEEVV